MAISIENGPPGCTVDVHYSHIGSLGSCNSKCYLIVGSEVVIMTE